MSSPFLATGSGSVQALLTSGQQPLNVSTIIDQSLIPNLPVCSDADKKMISRQIQPADLGFSVLTNPFVGTLTADGLVSDFTTSERLNLVQQATMSNPSAGSNTIWTLDTDERIYTTDSSGTIERIAYTSDGTSGDTISNGVGESITVNLDGSISYIGGRVESTTPIVGAGSYGASESQSNLVITDPLITEIILPAVVDGTVFNIRREYPVQIGEVWPASVFGVSAVGSTIEGLALFPVAPYTSIRVMFVGTRWVLC